MRLLHMLVLAVLVGLVVQVRADETVVGSVEGKITLNGKPIEKGKVAFHPEKGKPVEADIKDGDYAAKGVPVGTVRITVKAEGVPPKFGGANTTTLTAEVKKGKNNLDLDLKN
jgi:hypothetical protein